MTAEEAKKNPHLITRVLRAVARDEPQAADELLPMVYNELRRLAKYRLERIEPGQTLQATALVHEAWMRVVGDEDPGWDCRAHFFGAAARAMRNILVEQSRRKQTRKREGKRISIDEGEAAQLSAHVPVTNMLILNEALERLEKKDPLKAQLVMLRFFTGLTMPEVAEVLDLSLTRVEREWRFTRSWLQREVEGIQANGE